jgi:hypothetical protein
MELMGMKVVVGMVVGIGVIVVGIKVVVVGIKVVVVVGIGMVVVGIGMVVVGIGVEIELGIPAVVDEGVVMTVGVVESMVVVTKGMGVVPLETKGAPRGAPGGVMPTTCCGTNTVCWGKLFCFLRL